MVQADCNTMFGSKTLLQHTMDGIEWKELMHELAKKRGDRIWHSPIEW